MTRSPRPDAARRRVPAAGRPAPTRPAPVRSAPIRPAPVRPAPVRPAPVPPALIRPAPVRPATAAVRHAVAVVVLCALALLAGAAPAWAHTRLQSSDPADGASLADPPQRVSLTFNETMQADFSALTVIGPDGAAYQTGPVTAAGPTVGVAVLPLGPAGRYEIGYRVVSDDGHPVAGSVAFTLTTPGPAARTAPPSTAAGAAGAAPPAEPPAPAPAAPAAAGPGSAPDGGPPVWPWIVGGIVLLGGGVVGALRLGRG